MDIVAALAPPLVVAIAFVAVVRAVLRHGDKLPGVQDPEDIREDLPEDTRDDHVLPPRDEPGTP